MPIELLTLEATVAARPDGARILREQITGAVLPCPAHPDPGFWPRVLGRRVRCTGWIATDARGVPLQILALLETTVLPPDPALPTVDALARRRPLRASPDDDIP